MGLADIVRNGVALADAATGTLQVDVYHYLYSEATVDDSGSVTWGTPRVRKAIVEQAHRQERTKDGRVVLRDTQITFPRPFEVSPQDRFRTPDGLADGPPNRVAGIVDPATGKPYMLQIWLGSNRIT